MKLCLTDNTILKQISRTLQDYKNKMTTITTDTLMLHEKCRELFEAIVARAELNNKELIEENKKLKEENEKLKLRNGELFAHNSEYKERIAKMGEPKKPEPPAKDIECQCPNGDCGFFGSYGEMIKGEDGDGDEILFHPECIDDSHPDDYNICQDCNTYHHCSQSKTCITKDGDGYMDFCIECWEGPGGAQSEYEP